MKKKKKKKKKILTLVDDTSDTYFEENVSENRIQLDAFGEGILKLIVNPMDLT